MFTRTSQALTRKNRARPTIEELEDRFIPAVVNLLGPVIANVNVNTVYYGKEWAPADPTKAAAMAQTENQLDDFFRTVTRSPYMTNLNQYGVGLGTFGQRDVDPG